MRAYIKNICAILIFLNTTAFAITNESLTQFSPYADLTLNTHWDSQYEDLEPADLAIVSKESSVKSFHLAFITDAGLCQPAWGGQLDYSINKKWASHLTDKLQQNSIDYVVSFGGASGNDISKACDESQLISTFEQVINIYHPSGLDFDIENGSANVPKLMRSLKQVQAKHQDLKISFTLPVMPTGLVEDGKIVVRQAKTQGLNFSVNIMAMDYGPAFTNSMSAYAIQAATNLFIFLKETYPAKSDADVWQMVKVTPMIGVNDVNVEEFTIKDADALNSFAKQNRIGGLSMWSISRDNPCADKWASSTCSGNNLQTNPYEFAQHFIRL